ncbi:MAG: type II toxin-antitoxin system PemK/MazF family toxin [Candidatus Sungbacteria bacterium]|nr:type II toxin-antitoxin system PemK/MazF family toxin [Candidatus Sungbacteria bacterium]
MAAAYVCYDSGMKKFLEWIGVKQKIDEREHEPPLTTEGDFWWCAIGENVGIEVAGKSKDFTRPVVLIKRFGRFGFLGVPTTTKECKGTWYVSFMHKGIRETAMLSQARVFSYKRLDRKIGTLDDEDLKKVKEAYVRLFIQ